MTASTVLALDRLDYALGAAIASDDLHAACFLLRVGHRLMDGGAAVRLARAGCRTKPLAVVARGHLLE